MALVFVQINGHGNFKIHARPSYPCRPFLPAKNDRKSAHRPSPILISPPFRPGGHPALSCGRGLCLMKQDNQFPYSLFQGKPMKRNLSIGNGVTGG